MKIFVDHPPIAQPRQKFSARGGFARAYVDKKHPIWGFKQAVRDAVDGYEKFEEGPLEVTIWCYFQRPNSHYKIRKKVVSEFLKPSAPKWMEKTPDLDNLGKGVLDALNPDPKGKGDYPGFYPDDKFVVDLHVHKRYASDKWPVGVVIGIREIVVEVGMPCWLL